MVEYIYIGIIILFVVILIVVAKIEDGEEMESKEEE